MTNEQKIKAKADNYESATPHYGLGPAIFIDGANLILSNPSDFGLYTREQVEELLKEQRLLCSKVEEVGFDFTPTDAILNAPSP